MRFYSVMNQTLTESYSVHFPRQPLFTVAHPEHQKKKNIIIDAFAVKVNKRHVIVIPRMCLTVID